MLLTLAVFADQEDLVALGKRGQVTGLGNGFEDRDFLVLGGEHTGGLDGAKDGVFVVDHADMNHDVLVLGEVGLDLGFDEFLGLAFGKTSEVEGADDGILDVAGVIHEVVVDGALTGGRGGGGRACELQEVEGLG